MLRRRQPQRLVHLVCAAALMGAAVQESGNRAARGGTSADIENLGAFVESDDQFEVTLGGIGQELYFGVEYRLTGTGAPVRGTVRALIDGKPFCGGPLDFHPNERFVITCQDPWVAEEGVHVLTWELDVDDDVAETNEDNNGAEFAFIVADVDLSAERAYLLTGAGEGDEVAAPSAGQEVFVTLDYRFAGLAEPFPAEVVAFLDGEVWCAGEIDLEPDADDVIFCANGWTAEPGQHRLVWLLDEFDTITETDENNNLAEITFAVGEAGEVDLVAERAFLRASLETPGEVGVPLPGQPVFFFFDATVTGVSGTLNADVEAAIDGEPWCAGTIIFDPQGVRINCPAAWTAVAGPHTLRWVIDGENAVRETNEANNAVMLRFGVGTPPACPGDCNGDGAVTSSELVVGIWVMLGLYEAELCPDLDADVNGVVTIDEAVLAIDRAGRGC